MDRNSSSRLIHFSACGANPDRKKGLASAYTTLLDSAGLAVPSWAVDIAVWAVDIAVWAVAVRKTVGPAEAVVVGGDPTAHGRPTRQR